MSRAAALALALLALAGCGGGGEDRPELTVFAASSLRAALAEYGKGFEGARVRFSFAGTDQLAAQVRQGARPDVFASADLATAEELHREGLVKQPVTVAGNRVVMAVPEGSGIRSVEDAAQPHVELAVGARQVPMGRYTRRYLGSLGETGDRVLANVRTEEPDVASVTAKLRQGVVDAGFVYATEVAQSGGALTAIELDGAPRAALAAAVLEKAGNPEAAQRFVDGLLEGAGRDALGRAGFEQP